MADWVAGGALVDTVIAITLLETAVLLALWGLRGRGPAPQTWLAGIASGLCLMIALRAALADAPWPWIAVAIAFAGLAHAADMALRWPRNSRSPGRP